MIVIVKDKTKISKVTIRVCENATPGSWGSHQLLLDEYKNMDDCWTKKPNGTFTAQFEQMTYNTNWLKYMNKKYGELHCEYCGKTLQIFEWHEKPNLDILATTDHFFPKVKFPQFQKEYGNFVVSCHYHNTQKRANIINKYKIKFPYPEERIF